jgi:hypothetical protein
MERQQALKVRDTLCAYELNGRLAVSDSPTLYLALQREVRLSGITAPVVRVRVELTPTKMWFLNKFKTDCNDREFRVLKYDAREGLLERGGEA